MRDHNPGLSIGSLALIAGLLAGPALGRDDAAAGGAESDIRDSADRTIVIDGLEWALATNGADIKWPDAVEHCAALELEGHGDWRLPSLEELEGLHDPDAAGDFEIRSPFSIQGCCLWSGESLVDRPAEDGDEIAGQPEMYQWGFMFDGGLRYYAVHIFDDGRALCARDAD